MARNTIVPIEQLRRRAPEAGRIRIGVKTASAMKAIDTFRFTSIHEDLIKQLAELYGGKAKPWSDQRARLQNQWEVITTVNRIPVYLPEQGLSQWYEKWTGGGCERRCDGETVEVIEMHGTESVPIPYPCICRARNQRECRPHTRISVVIPELPFFGTWRLETKGWNAAEELPGMFDMVRALHDSGRMVQAVLGLEQRTDVQQGKKRQFIVPTLSVQESPIEIQAGLATVGAIGAGARAALPAPELVMPEDGEDADVVELYEPGELELRRLLYTDAQYFKLDPERFVAAVMATGTGQQMHEDMLANKVEPIGFKADGTVNWRKLT